MYADPIVQALATNGRVPDSSTQTEVAPTYRNNLDKEQTVTVQASTFAYWRERAERFENLFNEANQEVQELRAENHALCLKLLEAGLY